VKKTILLALALVASTFAAGCTQDEEPLTYEAQNVDRILLYDVRTSGQGGYNVYVDKQGQAWVQVVEPAAAYFDEKQYSFRISDEELAALMNAASDPEFAKLAQRRSPARPDGSTSTIEITLDTGETVTIKRNPQIGELQPFDATYELLRKAAEESPRTDPMYEGRFRWGWRPEGFEIPATQPALPRERQ
jgi:hypothetical protein